MLEVVLVLLFAVFSPFSDAPVVIVPPNLSAHHDATHHINFENPLERDSCSATAVGPHTLSTAGHCLLASNKIKIDDQDANVTLYVFDNADHMLVVTDATFKAWLPINQNALKTMHPGDPVHFWGNPGKSRDVYRTGVFTKWDDLDGAPLAIFQLAAFGGDSGSGIMNDSGEIVGVLSLGDRSSDTAVLPFAFSAAQLAQIK